MATKNYPATPFTVSVKVSDLNIRSKASMSGTVRGQTGKGVFTIVEVSDGWGKLKSGAGWIYLENESYCTINGVVTTTETTYNYEAIGKQLATCLSDIRNLDSYKKLLELL